MVFLKRLSSELSSRAAEMEKMNRYYVGDHPLPFITRAHLDKMHNEFRTLLEQSRSNFMRLVVDVVEERLRVEGFRLSASSDSVADQKTWDIWQANQMDSESQTAFIEALVKGVSYLSVWAGEREGDFPTIAVEDPLETIVGYAPGSNYRRRAAALKMWRDNWSGKQRVNVYLPEGIYKFEAEASDSARVGAPTRWPGEPATPAPARGDQSATRWTELEDEFVSNPLGVVPIVPLRNRPRLLVEGESELSDVIQVQDQINAFTFLLALAGYFGAHRQRWATGIKLMKDEATGDAKSPIDTAIDKLWVNEDPAGKFGDFEQTDLAGYINAREQMVLHIAVTTRTPRHYLIEQGQSPSGDAIKSAESGLVKKVERKMRPFGEGLEEALRLARRFAGADDSPVDSEVVWADPEIRSEAEITDAAIKKFQVGLISREQALEDTGYSQQQIARMLEAKTRPASPSPEPMV